MSKLNQNIVGTFTMKDLAELHRIYKEKGWVYRLLELHSFIYSIRYEIDREFKILYEPFENLPLYVNGNEKETLLVKWRIEKGK